MKWLKNNWLWLAVNAIAVLLLLGILSSFSLEFTAEGAPTVTIEQPTLPDREFPPVGDDLPVEAAPERGVHSPLDFLVHTTGEWAIRFLVFSLSCTPLYILFHWRKALTVKKALGLYAILFSGLHLLFFLADRGWLALFDEFNFILGLISLVVMVPLALTSNQWSMKALGKAWKLLHRAAYAAGIFALLHLVLLGEGSAIIYGVILMIGFMVRVPQVRKAVTGFRRNILRRSPAPA